MMKKLWLLSLGLILFACGRQSHSTQDISSLPRTAREFIGEHYQRSGIDEIHVEKYFIGENSYDVEFSDGTKITFDKEGKWKTIESEKGNIPYSILMPAISEYISHNYPRQPIVLADKDLRWYRIHLRNGIELRFSHSGEFREPEL